MNKIITSSQYYLAFAHFVLACDAQAQVRLHEKKLEQILKSDMIGDAVYSPQVDGTREDFDEQLSKHGISVDWLLDTKKKKKEEKEIKV